MRASAILRICICALAALGLTTASGVAGTAGSAGSRSVVIATPGQHAVVLVGADHQARKVMMRHRAAKIRPGSVVRYSHHKRKAKSNTNPIVVASNVNHVGYVKRVSVFGVVAKGHKVRLADGTKLKGAAVKRAVTGLKPGEHVAVSLRFVEGKSRVQAVRPKTKAKKVIPVTPPAPRPRPPRPPSRPGPGGRRARRRRCPCSGSLTAR